MLIDDPVNYLYVYLLSPIVSEFEKVHAFFQATDLNARQKSLVRTATA